MATKKTVRRKAVAARGQQRRGADRRGATLTQVNSAQVRKLNSDYKKSGGQIKFAKGTNAAFRSAVRKSMAAGEGARKANSKGQAAMVTAYAGGADRRSGQRRGERRRAVAA